jgi:hypothetical protein
MAVVKIPDSDFCRKLVFSAPKILNPPYAIAEKCEIRIVEFLDSMNFLENYFGCFAELGGSIQDWCKELHVVVFDVAKLIRGHSGANSLVELCDLLRDEASRLDDLLTACPEPVVFDTNDEKTFRFLESFEDRLKEEIEFTRKVGYELYSVLIGAA